MVLVVAAILSAGPLPPVVTFLVASMKAPAEAATAMGAMGARSTCAVEPSGADPHSGLLDVPSVSFSLSRYSDFTWLAMVSYKRMKRGKGGSTQRDGDGNYLAGAPFVATPERERLNPCLLISEATTTVDTVSGRVAFPAHRQYISWDVRRKESRLHTLRISWQQPQRLAWLDYSFHDT